MAEAGEQATGTKDESYDIISVLYHSLQAASEVDQYIHDAEQAGDAELVEFFRDYQDAQKDLAERAKNLLGARLMRTEGTGDAKAGQKLVVVDRRGQKRAAAGAPTNARVKSGGRPSDDVVDEQSKESFPASDAPGTY